MIDSEPARPTTRRIRAAGLLVAIAASTAALGSQLLASASSTASSSSSFGSRALRLHRGALDEADGVVPDGMCPAAIDRGCPPMYADPTHDPRMQQ